MEMKWKRLKKEPIIVKGRQRGCCCHCRCPRYRRYRRCTRRHRRLYVSIVVGHVALIVVFWRSDPEWKVERSPRR